MDILIDYEYIQLGFAASKPLFFITYQDATRLDTVDSITCFPVRGSMFLACYCVTAVVGPYSFATVLSFNLFKAFPAAGGLKFF